MAMGLPVIASRECATPIDAVPERDFLTAGSIDDFIAQVSALLREPARAAALGGAGRKRVVERYSWDAHLSTIDRHIALSTSKEPT
jgi:glycosyltransferase involved in cell wall biosynthesis